MTEGQKTAVIFGLANKRSIAWAIAQKLSAAGWRLGIAYMNERLGLEAQASDLNPVAVLISKAMIEVPPKFANRPAVHPDAELIAKKRIGRDPAESREIGI